MKQISVLFIFVITTLCSVYSRNKSIQYQINDSRKYAAYAAVAFCPSNCVQTWSCKTTQKYHLKDVKYITNNITKAVSYLGYDSSEQQIIVSWRGSNNIQNWIEDFNFQMQPYEKCKGCYIHVGFLQDFKRNQKKLFSVISQLISKYSVKSIINTGHSLGAALSTITGLQLSLKYPSIKVHVHNFGSPRLGNENLAQFINDKVASVTRVVHNRDLVPHLPPQIEYKHAANEVFFDQQMVQYTVCNDSGEDKACSNKYFPNYDPNDHDFYFEHISRVQCC